MSSSPELLLPPPHSLDRFTPQTQVLRAGRPTTDVNRLLRVLKAGWKWVVLWTILIVGATAVYTFTRHPVYEPSGRLEVDPPGTESFSMDALNPIPDAAQFLETQAEILKSETICLQVIRELGLAQNSDFAGPSVGNQPRSFEAKNGNIVLTPSEAAALDALQDGLSVSTYRSNRMVDIRFGGHDPTVSASIVNKIIDTFIDQNYKTRYDAIMHSSVWLTHQLDDVRQSVDNSNRALADFQRQTGITNLDQQQNTVTQRISELNKDLAEVSAARVKLQATVERLGPDGIPLELQVNTLLQDLTARLADAQAELVQSQTSYGQNNPKIQRLQNKVAELQRQVSDQKGRLKLSLMTDYAAAEARESLLTKELSEVTALNGPLVQYGILKRDADSNRALYDNLFSRIKEAGIAAASRSSNVRVIDRARVLDSPTRPRVKLNLAIGVAVGLVCGIFFSFVKAGFDKRVRRTEDIRMLTGVRHVSVVPRLELVKRRPRYGNSLELVSPSRTPETVFQIHRPLSLEAEAVRMLRTQLVANRDDRLRSVLITSPAAQEGKTTLAVNFAVEQARHGRTCLIDADLRKPGIAAALAIDQKMGLADVLTNEISWKAAVAPVDKVPGLSVLPAGNAFATAPQLVTSAAMRRLIDLLRTSFDYLVIDSPPLLSFAESRALAGIADGVIIVNRQGCTTFDNLVHVAEVLSASGAQLLGIVLNSVDPHSAEYEYLAS